MAKDIGCFEFSPGRWVVTDGRNHISEQYVSRWDAENRRDALEFFFRAMRKDYHTYEEVLLYDTKQALFKAIEPHCKSCAELHDALDKYIRAAIMAEKEICSL